MAQHEFDVASLGIIVADVLARPVERMPEPGKLELIDGMDMYLGGLAAATARVLGKLGARVAMIGKVGADGFGDFVLDTLRESGVNIDGVKRDDRVRTSGTVVMISPDGERSFFHYPGASDAVRENEIDFGIIERSRILHFGGPFLMKQLDGEPIARILNKARSQGIITSMDTAWDGKGRWLKVIEPALSNLDIILTSLEEARAIAGKDELDDIVEFFVSYGVNIVAIKMGAEGCYIRGNDESHRIEALRVDVVDTTGAGDAFAAGFLYGIAHEWRLSECGQFANAVGALTVTMVGGSEAVESYEATTRFMKEKGIG